MHHLNERHNIVAGPGIYPRLALVGTGLLAGLASPSPWLPAIIGFMAVGLILRTGVRPSSLAMRLTAPLFMGLTALLASLFLIEGAPVLHLHLGWINMVGSEEGLAKGSLVFARVFNGAALVLLLSMTTPVTELLAVAQRMRISPLFLELVSLAYRYIFVLAEEASSVMSAQKIRLGYHSFVSGLGSFGVLSGMVFVRSYDRAERVATAMKARGLM